MLTIILLILLLIGIILSMVLRDRRGATSSSDFERFLLKLRIFIIILGVVLAIIVGLFFMIIALD